MFQRPGEAGRSETSSLVGEFLSVPLGHVGPIDTHGEEKEVAEIGHKCLGEHPGVAALAERVGDRRQNSTGVAFHQRRHQPGRWLLARHHAASGHYLVEGGEGVTGRAATLANHVGDGVVLDGEVSLVDHPADVVLQLARRQQFKVEVLGAALDRGQNLLRVGGGQHEDDVWRRLLQRLQQCVRGRTRQHVHLIEDVHLVAARRAQGRSADQVTHGVHTVVGRRVQLVQVHRRAGLHGPATVALAARLTVDKVGAVQRPAQDAGGRGFAATSRAAEHVGVPHRVAAHSIAKGHRDVILAPHLGERAGTEAAVQGLVGHAARIQGAPRWAVRSARRSAATAYPPCGSRRGTTRRSAALRTLR